MRHLRRRTYAITPSDRLYYTYASSSFVTSAANEKAIAIFAATGGEFRHYRAAILVFPASSAKFFFGVEIMVMHNREFLECFIWTHSGFMTCIGQTPEHKHGAFVLVAGERDVPPLQPPRALNCNLLSYFGRPSVLFRIYLPYIQYLLPPPGRNYIFNTPTRPGKATPSRPENVPAWSDPGGWKQPPYYDLTPPRRSGSIH